MILVTEPMFKSLPGVLFSAFLLTATIPVAAETAIKKWVDANGITHYGTSIPPEYVDKPHTELNQRGITVRRVERAKTEDEIAREKELERLRKAQQQAIAEQRAKDRILLNMFRTEDDLVMARDGKLAQVDAQIKLKQAQVDRLKSRLAKWQASAAERERRGNKPTDKQLEHLREIEQQLENAYQNIIEKETGKKRISNAYAYDLERFSQLKSGFRARSAADLEAPREGAVIDVAGAFVCRDRAQCNGLWPGAKQWTEAHSGTPVEVIGERIMMTSFPKAKDKISLTVSLLSREGVDRIFLDINCHKSVAGRQLCASPVTKKLRHEFVEAMQKLAQQ